MASLQQIKSRLKSVATTKKITKAMQLVATAKLQKAQSNLASIQEYYHAVYDTFQDLLANVSDTKKLFPKSAADSTLWIIITSDLGLAGAYNSNIYKMADHLMKPKDKLIVIGTKGVSHYKVKNRSVYLELPHAGDNPNYNFASEVGETALAMYFAGKINTIKMVHTNFINSITFETEIIQLIPVDESTQKTSKAKSQKDDAIVEFEPSAGVVLMEALPLYITAMIFGSMVESKVSEMSSRRTAMENATDNAEEIIEKLDLEYNRARQATITQGITEIVAGSETE